MLDPGSTPALRDRLLGGHRHTSGDTRNHGGRERALQLRSQLVLDQGLHQSPLGSDPARRTRPARGRACPARPPSDHSPGGLQRGRRRRRAASGQARGTCVARRAGTIHLNGRDAAWRAARSGNRSRCHAPVDELAPTLASDEGRILTRPVDVDPSVSRTQPHERHPLDQRAVCNAAFLLYPCYKGEVGFTVSTRSALRPSIPVKPRYGPAITPSTGSPHAGPAAAPKPAGTYTATSERTKHSEPPRWGSSRSPP